MDFTALRNKVRIEANLTFETAFHIGSGKEGDLATDMGVLKDAQGWPVLPGSTIKGCFRATAERLSSWLGMTACLMDSALSEVQCIGDPDVFRKQLDAYQNLRTERRKLEWLERHSCAICRFFGSPLQASRIFFSDGILQNWEGTYQIRDGVAIDRDSHTARPKLKYDFEVVPRETVYLLTFDIENPTEQELALTAAVVSDWQSGFRLGGFGSRGLGAARLENVNIQAVDFTVAEQRKAYLMKRTWQPAKDLLENALETVLSASSAERGGISC
ncbi:type III CRISPR-associated RAMP protein Csx7 [Desulfatirhabdium butyrativorans]|uniref:type III CRISPR-associated RAMP protein Csx7 n=1 Tax=Desulfatirhabdium butyrativorans TaxID=340467 RepID=UPI00040B6C2C|nr:CRISPR-associated RAMP protein Csx7 [Desulfatirhabdium butyrativorans]